MLRGTYDLQATPPGEASADSLRNAGADAGSRTAADRDRTGWIEKEFFSAETTSAKIESTRSGMARSSVVCNDVAGLVADLTM